MSIPHHNPPRFGSHGQRDETTSRPLDALKGRRKRYGLQTMREGGGMVTATIIERPDQTTPDTNEGSRQ